MWQMIRDCIPSEEGKNNKIYLFVDSFPAHFTNMEFAESLDIEIIKIPEGTTDECQPLDCRIFGAIKSQARSFYNKKTSQYIMMNLSNIDSLMRGNPGQMPDYEKTSIIESAALLEILWDNVRKDQVVDAWEKAIKFDYDYSEQHPDPLIDEIDDEEWEDSFE